MGKYRTECEFELEVTPAAKVEFDKILKLCEKQFGIDKMQILSLEVDHEIDMVKTNGGAAMQIDSSKTIIKGRYAGTLDVNL